MLHAHWEPTLLACLLLSGWPDMCGVPPAPCLQDFTKEERQQLAVKSRTEVPKFGSPARQKVINEMHQRMLELQQEAAASSNVAGQTAAQPTAAAAAGADRPVTSATSAAAGSDEDNSKQQGVQHQAALQLQQQQPEHDAYDSDTAPVQDNHRGAARDTAAKKPAATAAAGAPIQATPAPATAAAAAGVPAHASVAAAAAAAVPALAAQQMQLVRAGAAVGSSRPGELPGDRGLTFLIVVLSVAIAAMLLKKVMTAMVGYRIMV